MTNRIDSAETGLPSPERTYYESAVRIPGVGSAPNRCRGYTPVGFCEAGHVQLGRSSCDTRYCPDHWRGWVRDGTEGAVARLAGFRQAAEGWGKRLLHIVASPEADRVSTDRFWSLMGDAQDVVEEAGARGGLEIAHPYRTSDRADMLFETAVEEGDWEREWGRWSFLRDLAGGDWETWETLTEAGPHFHFLVACRDFDPEAIREGWVVKNVRSFSRFEKRDLESYEDMARAAYYLRTHAAVPKGDETQGTNDDDEPVQDRASVRWFGEVHPNGFKPTEELGSVEWHYIQERAAEAVGKPIEEVEDGEGEEERECSAEECEAMVHSIEELSTATANADWMRSIPPKRRHRLRAAEMWLFEETVKPPPAVRSSRGKLREWLLETGRMYFGPQVSRQTGLSTFGGSGGPK